MSWLAFKFRDRALERAALHDAQALRSRYGANAEQWCDIGLLAASDPKKRRQLQSIRDALAALPA